MSCTFCTIRFYVHSGRIGRRRGINRSGTPPPTPGTPTPSTQIVQVKRIVQAGRMAAASHCTMCLAQHVQSGITCDAQGVHVAQCVQDTVCSGRVERIGWSTEAFRVVPFVLSATHRPVSVHRSSPFLLSLLYNLCIVHVVYLDRLAHQSQGIPPLRGKCSRRRDGL